MILNRRHKGREIGKWLTNISDPDRYDAEAYHTSSSIRDKAEREAAWNGHVAYVEAHIVGPPKATKKHTVEELRKMHMVGLYAFPEK